jgi:hypothetical protein
MLASRDDFVALPVNGLKCNWIWNLFNIDMTLKTITKLYFAFFFYIFWVGYTTNELKISWKI